MGYILIAAFVFGLDILIKNYMDKKREPKEETLLGGRIILRKYYNKGMALDMFSKWPWLVRMITAAILIVFCGIWAAVLREKENRGLKLGISLIVGGGACNLYDRIAKGHVVDYFSFKSSFPKLERIVFNISDLCIFLGSLLAAASSIRKETNRKRTQDP